jgi:hypothetical protein
MGMKAVDMTGQRFGDLVVIEKAPIGKAKSARWVCRCDCGTLTTVDRSNLRVGGTVSCGCRRAKGMTPIHGHGSPGHRTPEYRAWMGMIERCTNSNNQNWHRYGGRGIAVCERWKTFQNFLSDMGPHPPGLSPGGRHLYSLDRFPDRNGNYEPGNCRWATSSEQALNKDPSPRCHFGHVNCSRHHRPKARVR